MDIVIRNYLAGSHLLASEPNRWDAVVILDSNLQESEFISKHARNSLVLHFDDVTASKTGKRLPALEQVASAIQFGVDSTRLMVCCRAGQSRSAAIAFAIAFRVLGSDAAIGLLDPKRHSPNTLIIDLASAIIDDPMFGAVINDWRTSNSHIKLTDYLDEIKSELDALESMGARNRMIHS